MDRQIKKILNRKPTIEGAGVKLNRVLGNDDDSTLDPFLLFGPLLVQTNWKITSKAFLGILIEELKQSPTCGLVKLNMGIARVIRA